MTTTFKKVIVTVFFAVILGIAVLLACSQQANAMGDRNPQGSAAMPPDKVLTIAENTEVKVNFGMAADYSSDYYFRIIPKKSGYLTFTDDYTHSYVALCNEGKRLISSGLPQYGDYLSWNSQYPYQRWVSYGVKKGKTYLIRVRGGSAERASYTQPYIGTVKATVTKVRTAKYGKSKKKAAKIKLKKNIRGVIQAGSRKGQWYKVKANKKKVKIRFSAKHSCGTMICSVKYKSNGHWRTGRLSVIRSTDYYKGSGTLKSNRKVGTFYIKVAPEKKSSGAYTLKVK